MNNTMPKGDNMANDFEKHYDSVDKAIEWCDKLKADGYATCTQKISDHDYVVTGILMRKVAKTYEGMHEANEVAGVVKSLEKQGYATSTYPTNDEGMVRVYAYERKPRAKRHANIFQIKDFKRAATLASQHEESLDMIQRFEQYHNENMATEYEEVCHYINGRNIKASIPCKLIYKYLLQDNKRIANELRGMGVAVPLYGERD